MPADLRGVARGPGTFDQRTAGMAVARLGDAALSAPLSCRVCCRREAQGVHQLSGVVETGKVAECGHGGHRDRAWHPAEGLERVDDWGKPPGLHLGVECLCQTSQAFGVFGDRANLFLEHDLLGWSRTDHLAEPAQVGGAPGSPARIADIVPQEQRFEPELGGLEIADGIVTGAAQVPDGFILNLGTWTGVRSPERISRASVMASRRLVLTRFPGLVGINEGATTQPTWPLWVRER